MVFFGGSFSLIKYFCKICIGVGLVKELLENY